MKKSVLVLAALYAVSCPVFAAKPCEELKSEITSKLDAKGVEGYSLEIVPNDEVGSATVVGSCDGGTKKITYEKKGTMDAAAGAATSAAASSTPPAKGDAMPSK